MIKECPTCKKEFKMKQSAFTRRVFCSRDCVRRTEESKIKMSIVHKGTTLTEEHKRKIGEAGKGRVGHWAGKKKPFMAGANCHLWKGGISTENNFLRHTLDYRLWRQAVYIRDNYTCQDCGQRGYKLVADHIKPFAYYPELRFAIDNGRTLCIACHKKTDTYGWKIRFNYNKVTIQ